jgi:predicted alpha/beta hydrolase family esterase
VTKHVLFIQGAGEGAYEEDKELAASLRHSLGPEYEVHYPAMPNEDDTPYEQWKQQIEKELTAMPEPITLVGHSVGASILIKCVSELKLEKRIAGIFLIANPFWGGNGWRYEGYEELALPNGFAAKLPKDVSIVLYHCRDDEAVPFNHLALYADVLPQAHVRELDKGGHQLNNDFSVVAKDIKSLQ